MWSNFHTHSNYCDGKGSIMEFLNQSDELAAIGFSSHAPLPFDCAWCMKDESLDHYLKELNDLSVTRTPIYRGLEVDFIPSVTGPHVFAPRLDYTIGSIHFVESFTDGRRWEIDGTRRAFDEGLAAIFRNDVRAAVTRYFELTREMVATSPPTIVGHLDKIKIQNRDTELFSESASWYVSEVNKTLDVIQQAGVIVEVNTRGLYQKKSTTPYPSPWVLELIYSRRIPVTLSSDAHHPSDLSNCFSTAASLLRTIGFKTLSTLVDGEWKQVRFDDKGLIR